jgi:hypothetical protein
VLGYRDLDLVGSGSSDYHGFERHGVSVRECIESSGSRLIYSSDWISCSWKLPFAIQVSFLLRHDLQTALTARACSRVLLAVGLARASLHHGLLRSSIPLVARPSRSIPRRRTFRRTPDQPGTLFGERHQAVGGHDDSYDRDGKGDDRRGFLYRLFPRR